MRKSFLAALAMLAAASAGKAQADPITYVEQATLTGTLDGKTFSNALVTLIASGDTKNASPGTITAVNFPVTVTVTVAGIGLNGGPLTDMFTDTIKVEDQYATSPGTFRFVDSNVPTGNTTSSVNILGTTDTFFDSYRLATAFRPITNTATHGAFGTNFTTTGGSLSFSAITATVTGMSPMSTAYAVPEPSSIALMGLAGGCVLGFARIRRASKRS